MKKKNNENKTQDSLNFQITELFGVVPNWDFKRMFIGSLRRETKENGKEIVFGSVKVVEGKMLALGESQDEMAKKLDIICALKLDYGLHSCSGEKIEMFGFSYFLN